MNTALPTTGCSTFPELIAATRIRIPRSHRPYSWDKRQWSIVLNDLVRAARSDRGLGLGTLTLQETLSEDGYLILVDGYQRIATLAILWHLTEPYHVPEYRALKPQWWAGMDWGVDHAYMVSLFRQDPPEATDRTRSQILLTHAFEYFRAWLDRQSAKNRETIRVTLDQQCRFSIVIRPDDQMIHACSASGLTGQTPSVLQCILTHFADLVRTEGHTDQALLIDEAGTTIRQSLGRAGLTGPDDEDHLFRAAYQVYYEGGAVQAASAISVLLERYRTSIDWTALQAYDLEEIMEFVDLLRSFAGYLPWIYRAPHGLATGFSHLSPSDLEALNDVLRRLADLPNSVILWPLLFAILHRLVQRKAADRNETRRAIDLLVCLEAVHVRMAILPQGRSRTRSPEWYYAQLGHTLFHHVDDGEPSLFTEDSDDPFDGDILDWIRQDLVREMDRHGHDEQVRAALQLRPEEDFQFTRWPHGGLAWFLAAYEHDLRAPEGRSFHLHDHHAGREDLDTRPPGKVVWSDLWRWEDQADTFGYNPHEKNRLGNFFLRDLTMDDRHPAVGLPDYIQVLQEANAALPAPYRLAQVDELTGILAKARQRLQDQGIPPDRYPDLPRVVCDLREERMIRFALERWRISMGEVMKSSGVTAN